MPSQATEPAARHGSGLVAVDGRTYPLSAVRLAARAEAGVAWSTLHQVFDNPHDEALEVIYTLPLPADGAVLGYVIRIGEKVIRGEIERRERAEARYREALYEGRTAGLLEQNRADTFQQRLGNLAPRTRVEVEIEVMHPLAFVYAGDDEMPRWEYRFPTVVGVRYQGEPGRVPDADRLEAERDLEGGIPTRAELALTIVDVAERATAATSTSHAVDVAPDPAGAMVHFAHGERLDRDVAVGWAACAPEVGVTLVTGGGLPGDAGRYGVLTVVPPAVRTAAFARDLTILIDASGSMAGEPLECAKQIAQALIRSLEEKDRFEILSFANAPRRLTSGLEKVSERSIGHAFAELAKLQAAGGTEMGKGIEEALHALRDDAQRQVILLSDGEIGFEHEIVGRVASTLPAGCRLHAVGIGSAPNRTLTHALARAGRGVEIIVDRVADAAEAVQRLVAATSRPVLTDLTVRGTALKALAPARPADVFAGRPLRLTAELAPDAGTLEIEGRLASSHEPWRHRIEVPAGGADASPLPIGALHGRETIADLEQELATSGHGDSILERIESRGLRHRITSIRTSLVAIAEEPSVDPKQPRRREKLAVELPAGVSAEGVGLMGARFGSTGLFTMAMPQASMADGMARGPSKGFAFHLAKLRPLKPRPDGADVAGLDLPLAPAKVIRREANLLIVELEVPFGSFEMPDEVEVSLKGKLAGTAKIDPGESSPKGPHQKGVLLRLALRFEWSKIWGPDMMLALRWGVDSNALIRLILPVAVETASPT